MGAGNSHMDDVDPVAISFMLVLFVLVLLSLLHLYQMYSLAERATHLMDALEALLPDSNANDTQMVGNNPVDQSIGVENEVTPPESNVEQSSSGLSATVQNPAEVNSNIETGGDDNPPPAQ